MHFGHVESEKRRILAESNRVSGGAVQQRECVRVFVVDRLRWGQIARELVASLAQAQEYFAMENWFPLLRDLARCQSVGRGRATRSSSQKNKRINHLSP